MRVRPAALLVLALLTPMAASAGKKAEKAASDAVTDVPTPPADPNAPVVCTSADGLARVELPQPNDSTFAAGPGECWLTLRTSPSTAPIRMYVGLSDGEDGLALADDRDDAAVSWAKRMHVLHRDVQAVDTKQITIDGQSVIFHRVRGRPNDSPTIREALVGHVVENGHDVVLLAHYDAYGRPGISDQASKLLSSITLGDHPAKPEKPARKTAPAVSKADEAAPGDVQKASTDVQKTPTDVQKTSAEQPVPAKPAEDTEPVAPTPDVQEVPPQPQDVPPDDPKSVDPANEPQ